jgi:hypothetical protein
VQQRAKPLLVEPAVQRAVERDGDLPALLGDHDHRRVHLLGETERGAVARPELVRRRRRRERQEAPRRREAGVLHHRRAVVERARRLEQGDEQLGRDRRVEAQPGVHHVGEIRRALEHHERADALTRELDRALHDRVHRAELRRALVVREGGEQPRAAAQLRERPADVRLEEDDHAEDERVAEEVAEQPGQRLEADGARAHVGEPEQAQPHEDRDRACPSDEAERSVDEERDHEHVDDGEQRVAEGGVGSEEIDEGALQREPLRPAV